MKNIKEKEQLIKMSLALGVEPDPKAVKDVLEYKQMMAEVKNKPFDFGDIFEQITKLKSDIDLLEKTKPPVEIVDIPKPPSIDELNFLFEDKSQPLDLPKPPTVDELLEQINVVEEKIKEIPPVKSKLVDLAATHITKEVIKEQKASATFQQPDIPIPQTISELKRKVKMLEDWLAKVSMAGPGSGEVNLLKLDDVDTSQLADNKYLKYNAANGKIEFATVSGGGGGGSVDSVNGLTGNVILTTANITESINLYYTDSRVYAAVSSNLDSKANVSDLTTSNVLELTNLYFTTARANSAIDSRINKTFVDNLGINAATLDGINSTDFVLDTDLTTANVAEVTNLYFTNARSIASLVGQSVTIGEATITGNLFVLGNVVEFNTETLTIEDKNIVLANGSPSAAASNGAGISVDGANANIIYNNSVDRWSFNKAIEINSNLVLTSASTTTDLSEGTNLYFTELRANTAIDNRVTKAYVDTLGIDAATLDGIDSSFFALDTDLTTANVLETTNLYFSNSRATAAVAGNLELKANVVDLTTANVVELTNLYYTNARVSSFITPSLTTANVSELTNLYFTNARARLAISQGSGVSYNNSTGVISANVTSVAGRTGAVVLTNADISGLTTANVSELTNLYYTNARVSSFVTPSLTTANVSELTNLYFTNARANVALVSANVIVNTLFSAGNISSNAFITSPFFYSESDIALKEDVLPINDALNKVLSLFGVSFKWKSNHAKSIGVIAQDVEKIVPEIVSKSATGSKTVSYDSIIPLLIEAIKEQQKQIEDLKNKIK